MNHYVNIERYCMSFVLIKFNFCMNAASCHVCLFVTSLFWEATCFVRPPTLCRRGGLTRQGVLYKFTIKNILICNIIRRALANRCSGLHNIYVTQCKFYNDQILTHAHVLHDYILYFLRVIIGLAYLND